MRAKMAATLDLWIPSCWLTATSLITVQTMVPAMKRNMRGSDTAEACASQRASHPIVTATTNETIANRPRPYRNAVESLTTRLHGLS